MAITVIHVNKIVTVDGAGTSTGANWLATDTVVDNVGTAQHQQLAQYMRGAPGLGYMREFSVSNVAGDRTVLYLDAGSYLFRVTTAGQSITIRKAFPEAVIGKSWGPGKDYDTDAALNTSPGTAAAASQVGLTTIDGVNVGGQPVNTRHHIIRETEGPRRIDVPAYMKIGIVASALATAVELEIAG